MTIALPRPEVAPATPWSFPTPADHTLDNGLRVLLYHLPGKRVAALRLLVDLPTGSEARGAEGVGQLALQALTQGTSRYDEQQMAVARDRLGATCSTSCDSSGGHIALDAPVSRLSGALDLLAEIVLRPTFPTGPVERLMKQRLDRIAADLATPGRRAQIELDSAWYAPGSRGSVPTGGTTDTVGGLTRDAVAGYYLAQVSPETSTLVVAGDLSWTDILAKIEAHLGTWKAEATPRPPRVDDVIGGTRVVIVDRPGSVQTQITLAQPAVRVAHPDLQPLSIAAYALGGGMESRIMTVLREDKGYTYGIKGTIATERHQGRLVISGAVQSEVTVPALMDLFGILHDFTDGGITEDERVTAVEKLAGGAPLKYETPQAIAGTAAGLVAQELPLNHPDVSRMRLRAATTESVDAAFRRHTGLDRGVLVLVGDAATFTEDVRGAGFGDVSVAAA